MYPLRVVGNIALGRVIEFVQTKYRWVIVIPLVLPLSLLYNLYSHVRNLYIWYMKSSPTRHAQKVARVAKQVRENGNEKVGLNGFAPVVFTRIFRCAPTGPVTNLLLSSLENINRR